MALRQGLLMLTGTFCCGDRIHRKRRARRLHPLSGLVRRAVAPGRLGPASFRLFFAAGHSPMTCVTSTYGAGINASPFQQRRPSNSAVYCEGSASCSASGWPRRCMGQPPEVGPLRLGHTERCGHSLTRKQGFQPSVAVGGALQSVLVDEVRAFGVGSSVDVRGAKGS